ncbi:MAG: LLM class F420-dependent oxidoreductase [Actinomycetota bacterium]|nr:LLM class F420-dependent oxidoreductase [Acidimicrobiia bacterium]MDQ3147254.1 LLM class F420-dependent oxidoreductase [Actinomycetota bacterium]
MRLGLNLGYFGAAPPSDTIPVVQHAESLGFHSVWTAEAYGSDAVVPLTWAAAHTSTINLGTAIMQMPARTPANTAMTAATFDLLSGGRFLLGLGLSGPQVVEGWHGEAYGKPLGKTREYVSVVREILRRERPLEHHGAHYDIPYAGADATGLGKPLKLIIHPRRPDIPIYLAAIGPKNVALTAELADGWLPVFFSPGRFAETYGEAFAGTDLGSFDIAPTVSVVLGDDVEGCRNMVKPGLALYIGGMGARGRNFYNDLACRYGYEGAAKQIQDLYLDGNKREAVAAVPDELVDEVALCGPKERIAERLEAWQRSPVTTLIVGSGQREALEVMAELVGA